MKSNSLLMEEDSDLALLGNLIRGFQSRGVPTPQANAKLNPPSPQTKGYFGATVAVRARTVVVGEYNATVNGNAQQGAAYVFERP